MSHIPAAKMPHAAPHHHDAEEPARNESESKATESSATAVTSAAPAETPAQPAPAPDAKAKAARSGWTVAALAVGGVALAAAVAAPLLRGKASRSEGDKA